MPHNKITKTFQKAAGFAVDKTSDVLSAPARRKARVAKKRADRDVSALKLSRETKGVHADPKTKQGRKILNARLIANDVRRASKGKKRLFGK